MFDFNVGAQTVTMCCHFHSFKAECKTFTAFLYSSETNLSLDESVVDDGSEAADPDDDTVSSTAEDNE